MICIDHSITKAMEEPVITSVKNTNLRALKIAQFITLFLLVLVAGVFWGTWFSLSRSLENFSSAEFIHIGKTIIENVAMPMRFIMPLSILCMLISIWLFPRKRSTGFYFFILSFILLIITLLITVFIEVPIDNQLKEWTVETIPSNWETIRDRWGTFHTIRTMTSLASFVSFLFPILFTTNRIRYSYKKV